MTAKRIDGKAKAEQLAESIAQQTAALLAEHDIKPGLAVVIIGEDPASQVYVRNKKRRAEACGFHSVQHTLAEDTPQDAVLELIDELNKDDSIHGILVQLPLPGHLNEQTASIT
jgi:methylenetetrahydrofolate dehydrogenase (NADP+)/methenyltetrahydrofolate cyclohydrolase